MADPFLAEIRIFPFNFPPSGWAFCNGQVLPINQNTALFSLVGTTYGGNGISTFALPNLQGNVPLHFGQGVGLSFYSLGQTGGETAVTLIQSQMAAHTHPANASSNGGTQDSPVGGVWSIPAAARGLRVYDPNPGTSPQMSAQALGPAGSNQAHDNMMPYLTLNFCIALVGIFPPRS